ncbi:MAG: transketolase [Clostridiales bacterium]|nr:transketolase [Clostridiales bacterium]
MELARKKQVKTFAAQIRIETLKALGHLGFGHLGGSLSIADLLAVLYSGEMKIDPADPDWEDRDFLICSKGHAGPGIYATLALKGYFPMEQLLTINQGGTHLPSHCDHNLTPGIDMTTGSLGQGSSLAVGVALGKRIQQKEENYTYLILGDGEIQEGQVWEALSFAAQQKLSHLITFVDWNKRQLDGPIAGINDFSNVAERFAAFGWDAVTVDGHDVEAIADAIHNAKMLDDGRPHCIVLDTVKGKGVRFVSEAENNHHVTINAQQLAEGLAELEAELAKVVAE